MSDKMLKLHDTTMRDGQQSLWAMRMTYGMLDAVVGEIAQAGYDSFEIASYPSHVIVRVRFFKEDPWETLRMIGGKIKDTQSKVWSSTLGMMLIITAAPEPVPIMRLWIQLIKKMIQKWDNNALVCCTRDEITREFPTIIPLYRSEGIEPIPNITYTDSPRHTDEYYARVTREIVQKYKPVEICIKDVGGLLTVERAKTLIPVMMQSANGTPLQLHSHGMSGQHTAVFAEAMRLGVRKFHTCIPPLAYGSSHPSVYNTMHNARLLGLETNMNEELLKVVEERLTVMGKQDGLPVDTAPLPYDVGVYKHKVPGGVISNAVSQLEQLGIGHKLDEVLEEIPRIVEDLGYPIMITPHSQFIVTQAAINVATGERYKEIIDAMIEFALGVYGVEDAGLPYMNQNVKDIFLSHPNAKRVAARWAEQQEHSAKEVTIKDLKKKHGMLDASDEDFMLYYIMKGHEEIKKMREAGPPRGYYTGKEPLPLLLRALCKEKDISRLTMRKGNSFFEFRQKI